MSPEDLHKAFTVWLACSLNHDVFLGLSGGDAAGTAARQALADKTGLPVTTIENLISTAIGLDTPADSGQTTLSVTAATFNSFVQAAGYTGPPESCGNLTEILSAM